MDALTAWVHNNCKFAQGLPKLVPPWMSNKAPATGPKPIYTIPQPPPQPQKPQPEPYNPKADWPVIEERLKRMGIRPGSFEYSQYERARTQGQDAILKYVGDLEKQYYGRVLAWVYKNCKFAQAAVKKLYHCTISYNGAVVAEDDRMAVSEAQARARFWWAMFNGDKIKIEELKKKGYKCTAVETYSPPAKPAPIAPQPKPNQKPKEQQGLPNQKPKEQQGLLF